MEPAKATEKQRTVGKLSRSASSRLKLFEKRARRKTLGGSILTALLSTTSRLTSNNIQSIKHTSISNNSNNNSVSSTKTATQHQFLHSSTKICTTTTTTSISCSSSSASPSSKPRHSLGLLHSYNQKNKHKNIKHEKRRQQGRGVGEQITSSSVVNLLDRQDSLFPLREAVNTQKVVTTATPALLLHSTPDFSPVPITSSCSVDLYSDLRNKTTHEHDDDVMTNQQKQFQLKVVSEPITNSMLSSTTSPSSSYLKKARKSLDLLEKIPKFNHRRKSISSGSSHSIGVDSTSSSGVSTDPELLTVDTAGKSFRSNSLCLNNMSLEKVIDDKNWRALFLQYLCSEHAEESLEFILSVNKLEQVTTAAAAATTGDSPTTSVKLVSYPSQKLISFNFKTKAKQIYDLYVRQTAEKEVNLCAVTREMVNVKLHKALADRASSAKQVNQDIVNAFKPAKDEITCLLRRDSYPRFCKVYQS